MIRVERRVLMDRLRVAAVEIPGVRSVSVLVALEAGQWFEPRGRAGVARLTAQSLLRGTVRHGAAAWGEALDELGAGARLDTGAHAAFFTGQCLAEDLRSYLGLVADAVLRPAFASTEVEFVRAHAVARFEEDATDTRAVADRILREMLYPAGHPFRTRALGDESVVRDATVDELRAHHRRAILGGRAVVVMAGAVEGALAAVADAFGDWPAGPSSTALAVPHARFERGIRRDEVVADKTQCDVILGWLAMPRTDPRFTAARVANMIFAADTFASRAGHVVRDELGLAYYVFSSIQGTLGESPWTLRMGVNPENVERAIAAVNVELAKILAGDIADDDLTLARDKLVGELVVGLESPGGVAHQVLEAELFGLGDDHLARYPDLLRAVTRDEVVAVAREFLRLDRCAIAVAGPPLPGGS